MADLVFDKVWLKLLFVKEVPGDSKPKNDQGLFFCFTGNWTPWYGCAVLVAKRQSIIWCQAAFCFSLPLKCFDQTLRKSVKSINQTAVLLFSTMWLWYARELNLIADSQCRLTFTSVQNIARNLVNPGRIYQIASNWANFSNFNGVRACERELR